MTAYFNQPDAAVHGSSILSYGWIGRKRLAQSS